MNQVGYLAIGDKKKPTYEVLSQPGERLFGSLAEFLTEKWPQAGGVEKRELNNIAGCLEKLSAFLMQVQRMKKYHDALVELAEKFNHFGELPLPITLSMSKSGREECADFESLLLQGRAALDRLTWYVAKRFKQSCSSFSRLENVLKNAMHDDATQILNIIGQAKHLELSLIAPGNPDPLRDFIAHKAALKEIMENCFTVYYLGRNLAIISDCEAGLPLFKTSHNLAMDLPYVVLNSLAVLCGIETIQRELFAPSWTLKTVVVSEYVEKDKTGFVLHVTKRMTPSGFEATNRNVNRNILQCAMELKPGPKSFEVDLGQPQD